MLTTHFLIHIVAAIVTFGASGANAFQFDFGLRTLPSVWLNVSETNHTNAECVIINGKELCASVDDCPAEAYECTNVQPGVGHGCILESSKCSCTATYGDQPCSCDVSPMGPDLVAPSIRCVGNFSLDQGDVDCFDPPGFYYPDRFKNEQQLNVSQNTVCYRGSARFSTPKTFEMFWTCEQRPSEQQRARSFMEFPLKPPEDCTCKAYYNNEDCYSCEPCLQHEPGDFRALCPGIFMDCFQSYSFWDEEKKEENTTPGVDFSFCRLFFMSAFHVMFLLTALLH